MKNPRFEKTYMVYWRFKGKEYNMTPVNITEIKAYTKKEVKEQFKDSEAKILRIEEK